METPSSVRTLPSSQSSATVKSMKQQDGSISKSITKPDRPALLDITNDSLIVGLAKDKSPTDSATKIQPNPGRTPGSGEALLRSQVRTLLQRVEEEEGEPVLAGGIDFGINNHRRLPPFGFIDSPSQLLAPTPANTPQVPDLSGVEEESIPMAVVLQSGILPEQQDKIFSQAEGDPKQQDQHLNNTDQCLINRLLFFDSPWKSEASSTSFSAAYSSLTYETSVGKPTEDDNSSSWSIQVNASSTHHYEDEDLEDYDEAEELDYRCNEELNDSDTDGCVDDLCEVLGKMTVKEQQQFAGRHTRFVYNSDDEIDREEEVDCRSPGVVLLKGVPAPEGKHIRFPEEEEEEDDEA